MGVFVAKASFVLLFTIGFLLAALCCGEVATAICGDLICDRSAGENCSSCATDCIACAVCGDGLCGEQELSSCPADCGAPGSPHVLSALLDSATGAVVTITFSEAVSHPISPLAYSCDDLVSPSLLGENAQCHWLHSDQVLLLKLGLYSNISAGSVFSFLPSAGISSRASSLPLVSAVFVNIPVGGLAPPQAVLGATTACYCNPVDLNSQLSRGVGTVPLRIHWSLDYPTDSTVSAVLAAAENKERVGIYPDLNKDYTVRLTVTDQYNRSATVTRNVSRTDAWEPSVIIEGPTTRTILSDESFSVTVLAHEEMCEQRVAYASLEPLWSIQPQPAIWNTLEIRSSALSIPANSLEVGQYVLSVLVQYNTSVYWDLTWSSRVNMTLNVLPAILPLAIGGDTFTAQPHQLLVALTDQPRTTTFSWVAFDQNGATMASFGGLGQCNFTLPSTLPAQVCLTATRGSRNRTLCSNLVAQSSSGAHRVFLAIPGYGLQTLSRDRKITVLGSESGVWTITPSIPMNSSSFLSNPRSDPNLVILPRVLEPHKAYTIRLTVPSGSWSEIILTMEGEAFGGTISFSPKSGTALSDIFTADFLGWKNPDGTPYRLLSYSLAYISSHGLEVPIFWFGYQPHASFRFPMGLGSSHTVTLIVSIKTPGGTITRLTTTMAPIMELSLANPQILLSMELTTEYRRNDHMKQIDVSQALTNVLADSVTPAHFKVAEFWWLSLEPDSHEVFLHGSLLAMHHIQNVEILLRSVTGLAALAQSSVLLTSGFKNAVIIYTCNLVSQIVTLGLDEARQSIVPLLHVYDSMLMLANTTANDLSDNSTVDATSALHGAREILDGILLDLATHVCGEEAHYTSDMADLSNIMSTDQQLSVQSAYNVSVDITQVGSTCIPIHVRVLPLGSEQTMGIESVILITQANADPIQVQVISPVVIVLTYESSTSILVTGISAAVTSTRFPIRTLSTGTQPMCVWKADADSKEWTICGKPTIDSATNSYVCDSCPSGGGYFLVVAQQTSSVHDNDASTLFSWSSLALLVLGICFNTFH